MMLNLAALFPLFMRVVTDRGKRNAVDSARIHKWTDMEEDARSRAEEALGMLRGMGLNSRARTLLFTDYRVN